MCSCFPTKVIFDFSFFIPSMAIPLSAVYQMHIGCTDVLVFRNRRSFYLPVVTVSPPQWRSTVHLLKLKSSACNSTPRAWHYSSVCRGGSEQVRMGACIPSLYLFPLYYPIRFNILSYAFHKPRASIIL